MDIFEQSWTIEEKEAEIQAIVDHILSFPGEAEEIFSDLPQVKIPYVRYGLAQRFKIDHDRLGSIKKDAIPELYMSILRCWCHEKPLNECLTLKEDEYTWPKSETDPAIFDRMQEDGFLRYDEKRRRLYIPLCGTNSYDD